MLTSASPWWSGNIAPYGGTGLTAFNVLLGETLYPTLRNVAPVVAQLNVQWGVIEYHPALPITTNLQVYDDDMAVIERYKPALLVPIYWGHDYYQIQNTPFEYAMKALVDRIKDNPTFGELPVTMGPSLAPSTRPAALSPVLNLYEQLFRLRGRQTPSEQRGLSDPAPEVLQRLRKAMVDRSGWRSDEGAATRSSPPRARVGRPVLCGLRRLDCQPDRSHAGAADQAGLQLLGHRLAVRHRVARLHHQGGGGHAVGCTVVGPRRG